MQWIDEGLVLMKRPYGEHHACVTVFNRTQGVSRGMMRNRQVPSLGTFVHVQWFGRLEEQLGTYALEPLFFPLSNNFHPQVILVYKTMVEMLALTLQDHDPFPDFYAWFKELCLKNFSIVSLKNIYALFEVTLLKTLGYENHRHQLFLTNEHYRDLFESTTHLFEEMCLKKTALKTGLPAMRSIIISLPTERIAS